MAATAITAATELAALLRDEADMPAAHAVLLAHADTVAAHADIVAVHAVIPVVREVDRVAVM